MRLHKLEMSAFGPFGRCESVDFDALGADGLFLLHGQTGAGKTTILDAVAFALYGTVPGARREGKRLLSDHAEPGAVPTVSLEATLGGRRVRIVRSPEYFRPKKRGTGTTKQNAKATLTWIDGRSQNLTRLDEIGEAVSAALGMSADQFFQVVLLPQGEFARFLRAGSDERGDLLERLFDTARFGDIEEWFADARRTSAAALESSRIAIDKLQGRISTASGVEEQLDRAPVDWASEVLEAARQASVQSATQLDAARAASDAAVAELAKMETASQLQKRRAIAEQQLAQFHRDAPVHAALRLELERSAAAGPVAALAADLAEATSRKTRADAARDAAHRAFAELDGADAVVAGLASAGCDPSDVAADRAVVAEAVRRWTTEIGALDELRALAQRADAEEKTVRTLEVERAAVAGRIEKLEADRAALPAQIAEAEAEVQSAVRAAAELPALSAESARITSAVEAAVELAKARTKLAAATRAHEDARAAHNDARTHTLDLRERRVSGMAAELAARLTPGDPCSVCGSQTHPDPARAAESTVTKNDEDAAAEREQRAGAEVDRTAAQSAELTRVVDVLVHRSDGRDSSELVEALDRVTVALTETRSAAAQSTEREAALDRLRSQDQRLSKVLAEEQSTIAGLDAKAEHVRKSAAQIRERILAALDGRGDIDERANRLERLVALSTELLDRRADAARVTVEVHGLDETLARRVADSGFTSAEAAASHVVTAARASSIEKQLVDAGDLRAHAEQVLAESAIAAVGDLEPVDLGPLREAVDAAAVRLHDAVARNAECRWQTEQLEDLALQLWAAVDRAAPMQATHDELAALADVVAGRGQNARKMSLRSYVLASRLEDVAESASSRLRRMSAGRYEFVHSDEAEARGRRGGLGLDIRDDYTGVVRSAKTLSGGESFLASLSLALGLADVVAAESGGVVLDTMFIDEGFGTLDADTLEAVMGVLDELRAGGRVVGIVSHVDEMRQRIPSRLHVIRNRDGSTLQLFAAS
ncbi:AAA family ATPase [Rhodococcus sp. I2R]|uniref:AAA family ATPase n=1 Tax=Rhodococcus sp. I2R TaxID=2855445 RepID=UPI001E3E90CE|nr:SMC family ATPase [Rhodococcus sp. I2R]MCC8928666.1 SMC family ATPase [Rhodococcus sp. I2R]